MPLVHQDAKHRDGLCVVERLAGLRLFQLKRGLHHAQDGETQLFTRLHRGHQVLVDLFDERHLHWSPKTPGEYTIIS